MNIVKPVDVILIVVGLLILFLWIALYFLGKKNEDLFLTLDDEDFPMKELYFVGYAIVERSNIDFKSEKQQKIRKNLGILYGKKYIDFYIRAIYSQRFTMALTIMCFALPAYCFTESVLIFIGLLVAGVAAFFYYGTTLEEKIQKRQNQMLEEFSDMVSKLALLVNAGMILHDAWAKVAEAGDSQLYQEMQRSVEEMKNGVPETDALFVFGTRCMMPEIKKFSSTLIQGIEKGNSELASMLTAQSKEVWALKQQLMRRKGEVANSKLLIPMLLVFIGILIMVVVPIFSGLGA